MLKRIIEHWLTSLTERKELDVPFRLLLEAEGYIAVGHTTIHSGMEQGKDIGAWSINENLFHLFQTKTGNISPSDWDQMLRQMNQLILVPYMHPNYTPGNPFKPIWVCTGQLHETVRESLAFQNIEYRAQNRPSLEVWDRNILIEKFHAAFFDLVFTDEAFVVDFLRQWSHAKDYMSDEDSLKDFFHRYLFNLPAAKQRAMQKHLKTYVLISVQLSQRYISIGDLYSGIDCTLLSMVQLYDFIISQKIKSDIYQSILKTMNEYIASLLQQFVDEYAGNRDIVRDLYDDKYGLSEIYELPLRTHSLASKIALSSMLKSLSKQDSTVETELLQEVLENNPAFCHILSERQMGTLWVSIVCLLQTGQFELAKQHITEIFSSFVKLHRDEQIGLPDPYQGYHVAINHRMRTETAATRPISMRGQSYLLPILLKFICNLDLRDLLAQHWKTVSHMIVREYLPSNANELFAFRPRKGKMTAYGFPAQQSWSSLQKQYSERLKPEVVEFVHEHSESLLILSLVYPWRAQWREVERYISSTKENRWQ